MTVSPETSVYGVGLEGVLSIFVKVKIYSTPSPSLPH
jgi:hypothetical protein